MPQIRTEWAFWPPLTLLTDYFNTPIEPTLDTSQDRSSIPHKRLAFICKKLHEAQLLDVWRILHPQEDYTHFSHLHNSHSRIDYFLMDHHHLELLSRSCIEISTISDHDPISLILKIPSLPVKYTNWKLNDSLISEEIDIKEIGLSICSRTCPQKYLWEAHKAHICGKLIELGSRKKREHICSHSLLKDIGTLKNP